MAYGKFGFPAMTNRALGSKPSSPSPSSKGKGRILVRVTDIILDENHPNYNPNAGPEQIGQITGENISVNSVINTKVYLAYPSFSDKKNFPLVNEYVFVYQVVGPNSKGGKWVYDFPVSLYGALSPNSSAFPTPLISATPPSQNVTYTQVETGAFNIPDNTVVEIDLNSPNNPSQATFVEKSNIHPLMPFAGDIMYEGRWGNSLRFGGTAKSKSQYANNWSSAGNNGDPIVILRNGQPTKTDDRGWIPITENISNDLSSIYLTSYQKIPFSLSNEDFNSYNTPPTLPSQFVNPQIILNSDRVVLNAKTDSILISGQKSISLSTNETINIESKDITLHNVGGYLKLGSKNATESALLGDKTETLLRQLISVVKALTQTLETSQLFPSGVPVPDAAIGGVAMTTSELLSQLEANLKNIKSTKVKVI